MLLAWSLIYQHNFSPHRCYIWNNGHITFKNKSFFFKTWFENDIMLVTQLLSGNGNVPNNSEFLQTFHIPVTPTEFSIVMDAIPSAILTLLKGTKLPTCLPLNPKTAAVGEMCFSNKVKNNNRVIPSLFQKDITTVPAAVHYWAGFVPDLEWRNIWSLPYKYLLTNKVREVTFKLMHRHYPAKQYLLTFKKDLCVD